MLRVFQVNSLLKLTDTTSQQGDLVLIVDLDFVRDADSGRSAEVHESDQLEERRLTEFLKVRIRIRLAMKI